MSEEKEVREKIVDLGLSMIEDGLTTGTGGNISCRIPGEDYLLISPSGIPYEDIQPEDIPRVTLQGEKLDSNKPKPSSEAPMHSKIYLEKDRVDAIVHTHSPYASTVAAMGKSIPPIYYLIAFVGNKVPVADYATYGTDEIGKTAVEALGEENGILLEKHGSLAVGSDLDHAYQVASLIEELARIYYQTLSAGVSPDPLSPKEVSKLKKKFKNYG